jgi:chemotaxis protein MotB
MKQSILMLTIFSAVLASCGTNKKLQSANAQIATLNGQVESLNARVADCDKQVGQLKTENIQYSKEAEDCRKAKAAVAQRMENLNNALAEKGTSMKQIQQNMANAFKMFEDQGATVTYNKGLVHLNFENNFFFKPGSSKIALNGKLALNTVAQVMRDYPGVTAMIVGNTDTIPVKGVADNWSLSTERANAVVRVLDEMYYINPARLTSAGRGKFNPVAVNNSPEGRAKNRRIEIILEPDLSRLWELSETK